GVRALRIVERGDELKVERVRLRAGGEVLARRAEDARARARRPQRRRERLLLVALEREDLELRGGAAVRRRRGAADRDRDVLLAVDLVDRRPGRDLEPGLEAPEDVAGVRVERAEDAIAAAREAEPGRGRGDAAAARLRGDDPPRDPPQGS